MKVQALLLPGNSCAWVLPPCHMHLWWRQSCRFSFVNGSVMHTIGWCFKHSVIQGCCYRWYNWEHFLFLTISKKDRTSGEDINHVQDVQARVLGFTSRVFICSGTPFIHSLNSVSSSTLFGFSYKLRLMVRNWSEIWREGVQPTRVNQRMEPGTGFYYKDQKTVHVWLTPSTSLWTLLASSSSRALERALRLRDKFCLTPSMLIWKGPTMMELGRALSRRSFSRRCSSTASFTSDAEGFFSRNTLQEIPGCDYKHLLTLHDFHPQPDHPTPFIHWISVISIIEAQCHITFA